MLAPLARSLSRAPGGRADRDPDIALCGSRGFFGAVCGPTRAFRGIQTDSRPSGKGAPAARSPFLPLSIRWNARGRGRRSGTLTRARSAFFWRFPYLLRDYLPRELMLFRFLCGESEPNQTTCFLFFCACSRHQTKRFLFVFLLF